VTLDPAHVFREALERHGCAPRGREDQYMALCPEHDDREPSLSVGTGDDGRVLVNCFAGCATERIVERIGLRMRDLFPLDLGDSGRRLRTARREDFTGDARAIVNMLAAAQRSGERWTSALWLDKCPNCEHVYLLVVVGSHREPAIYCPRGCDLHMVTQALADRLAERRRAT
jgi:putative DNA primase/helicase